MDQVMWKIDLVLMCLESGELPNTSQSVSDTFTSSGLQLLFEPNPKILGLVRVEFAIQPLPDGYPQLAPSDGLLAPLYRTDRIDSHTSRHYIGGWPKNLNEQVHGNSAGLKVLARPDSINLGPG